MHHGREPAGGNFGLGNKRRKASDPSVGQCELAQEQEVVSEHVSRGVLRQDPDVRDRRWSRSPSSPRTSRSLAVSTWTQR